ncbi:MAG: hypothetical protein IT425_01660 [Pirellulales bacterium]|nr:hypothetical protein [Pirellulales bacterium]
MNIPKWVSPLFVVAAIYDGVLGVLFLAAAPWLFAQLNVPPPNHMAYVQFPAALLIIFAILFTRIALDPVGNRGQIIYGILLKTAYCGLAFYYWAATDIPWIWKPFAMIDLAMGMLFVVACYAIGGGGRAESR